MEGYMHKMKKSESSWKKIINAYENSNLPKAEFCRKSKVSVHQFYYWCSKLRPDLNNDHPSASGSSDFLPVKSSANTAFSITLSNEMAIRFDRTPEPSWVAKLLNTMERPNDKCQKNR